MQQQMNVRTKDVALAPVASCIRSYSQGIFCINGFAKSLRTQANTMDVVNSAQYASLALLRKTSRVTP